jgi:TM2 domain-containing membrane protein YozV
LTTFRFSCPSCGKTLKVHGDLLAQIIRSGKESSCPSCGASVDMGRLGDPSTARDEDTTGAPTQGVSPFVFDDQPKELIRKQKRRRTARDYDEDDRPNPPRRTRQSDDDEEWESDDFDEPRQFRKKYCVECGELIRARAELCPECGVRQPQSKEASNKLAAGLCGILVGALGVHKFILGMTTPGIIMVLVSLLTCGIGAIAMMVIGSVEGIIYLSKSDEDFYETYIVGKKEWF